ncbi:MULTISPECIES: arginine repressor [Myxococcaceae]|uniref:arginine repressor n=1 Tax=Myxococcaceae TaxID=31 RepID=UPI00188E85FE|nr:MULTISPECIES: arginine repressor [Myxococcaceae]MBF5043254.1 arginine repressor [Simulacricoccus sp. 17bor-14]
MAVRGEQQRNTVDTDSTEARREAVARIIRRGQVGTQEELRELLLEEGFDVTQATLSRDLARLSARRVSLPEGGSAYELPEPRVAEGPDALRVVREMVTGLEEAHGGLVVVKTLSGMASAVAVAIDQARLDAIAGSIAGDDTIFIAASKRSSPQHLLKQLNSHWLKA